VLLIGQHEWHLACIKSSSSPKRFFFGVTLESRLVNKNLIVAVIVFEMIQCGICDVHTDKTEN